MKNNKGSGESYDTYTQTSNPSWRRISSLDSHTFVSYILSFMSDSIVTGYHFFKGIVRTQTGTLYPIYAHPFYESNEFLKDLLSKFIASGLESLSFLAAVATILGIELTFILSTYLLGKKVEEYTNKNDVNSFLVITGRVPYYSTTLMLIITHLKGTLSWF